MKLSCNAIWSRPLTGKTYFYSFSLKKRRTLSRPFVEGEISSLYFGRKNQGILFFTLACNTEGCRQAIPKYLSSGNEIFLHFSLIFNLKQTLFKILTRIQYVVNFFCTFLGKSERFIVPFRCRSKFKAATYFRPMRKCTFAPCGSALSL